MIVSFVKVPLNCKKANPKPGTGTESEYKVTLATHPFLSYFCHINSRKTLACVFYTPLKFYQPSSTPPALPQVLYQVSML